MKILVTGTAGFIGFHLANALVARGDEVVGYDVINDYYDVNLKLARLKTAGFDVSEIDYGKPITSKTHANLEFIKADLADEKTMKELFAKEKFDVVVNLAAQAGVRYSLINPKAYIDSNITGFTNILECCRHNEIKNLVYASSSSVYGLNENMPFSTHEGVNHPISLYAATKKSNEMMAHTYSHLFGVPTTGLRFFTVYGPWGRPDMALFLFVDAALKGKKIDVFNYGKLITSKTQPNLKFIKADLADTQMMKKLFEKENFDCVVNLAAQAGVRYSLINPQDYIDSNVTGFMNILECCRHSQTANLVYASSSSVYGLNENMPFSTHEGVNHPISLYAATKKSNEMMAHTYSHLFGVPTTGLRFFTVYGPWGRPDMALFLFVDAALKGKKIDVFNYGKMKRDFTYVDDIVKGIIKCIDNPAKPNPAWDAKHPDPATSSAPFKVYNIGNNSPVELMDYIKAVELKIGREIEKNFLPLQAGDVPATYADVGDLVADFDYKPNTSVNDGVARFIEWYCEFYGVKI